MGVEPGKLLILKMLKLTKYSKIFSVFEIKFGCSKICTVYNNNGILYTETYPNKNFKILHKAENFSVQYLRNSFYQN